MAIFNLQIKPKLALLVLILFIGIFLRFYYQFIEWSFNGDEVDLGLGISQSSFVDLFSPLPDNQSAPPLFLFLEKLLSSIAKPFISFKILSFLSSCGSLLLFHQILKRNFDFILQFVLLALFCFNPFMIENSLTLKQYSLDLMLGLYAVNFFIGNNSKLKTFLFFSIFCLLSNIGLFFCVSLAIFRLTRFFYDKKVFLISKGIKGISPFILAPVPYVVYFIWYIQQSRAENLKNFMVSYWSGSFMPIDFSVFKWLAVQGKVLSFFFFSTYWIPGMIMLIVFLLSIWFLFENRNRVFQNELVNIICIYVLTTAIHLFFSALNLYPFSDRLFLYLGPGIYLIIGYGFLEIKKRKKQQVYKFFYKLAFLSIVFSIILYFNYLPVKNNDVIALMKFVNSTEKKITLTSKAKKTSLKWLEFTNYDGINKEKLKQAYPFHLNKQDADFLISVQSSKFGHHRRLSTPEAIIEDLLAKDRIRLFRRVNGYAIYKIIQ